MKFKIGAMYFAILGIIASIFGALNIIFAPTGMKIMTGFLEVFGRPWEGLILFFAGIFILTGSSELEDIYGLSMAVLGSMMVWIVAGCNIFARITESIPGEEGWFNTLEGFLGSYGPPYEPELWLLPFSLVILYFVTRPS